MNTRNLALPLIAFAGGAVLGRLLGLKTLARGTSAAAALTGMASRPASIEASREASATRRHSARPARKRVSHKRSKPM